jgi:hypothetical protein
LSLPVLPSSLSLPVLPSSLSLPVLPSSLSLLPSSPASAEPAKADAPGGVLAAAGGRGAETRALPPPGTPCTSPPAPPPHIQVVSSQAPGAERRVAAAGGSCGGGGLLACCGTVGDGGRGRGGVRRHTQGERTVVADRWDRFYGQTDEVRDVCKKRGVAARAAPATILWSDVCGADS